MKSLNKIRDELINKHYKESGWTPTEWAVMNFNAGFNAGAKAERERSQILVEALRFYSDKCAMDDFFRDDCGNISRQALEKYK
jgi:hypothetical protein